MLEVKKGDKVIVKGFTGIKLGVFEVESVTKKTLTVLKKNGDEMVFDKKTGKQINVEEGKEKYANSVMEDDGSFVAPSTKGATRKKAAKAATKKKSAPEPDPEDEEDEDEDEEEDEEPRPAKKTSKKPAKKSVKKSKKSKDEDDDEDEDEDEDDFEEVDD